MTRPIEPWRHRDIAHRAAMREHWRQVRTDVEPARVQKGDPRRRFEDRLITEYNLTLPEYDQMVVQQGGRCAICYKDEPGLTIDHDWTTYQVRGLLCPRCNRGIGTFDEDLELLEQAAAYLVR